MITQDEAIALAREVGVAPIEGWGTEYSFDDEELTALCNKVREQTLLEAAEVLVKDARYVGAVYELRQMAGVE